MKMFPSTYPWNPHLRRVERRNWILPKSYHHRRRPSLSYLCHPFFRIASSIPPRIVLPCLLSRMKILDEGHRFFGRNVHGGVFLITGLDVNSRLFCQTCAVHSVFPCSQGYTKNDQ
ncbi:hypothetical protein ARMGADRAFT_738255 [Armillaria gallica]|uniref:Uncharacterized protein n=1 Tax=Armillaria gallica TaxID=47427 RepID=A0A2H3CGX1_ARMGA|nr:hypothetical protein ARMGADRAFT_738255 [Armillaria gallica]